MVYRNICFKILTCPRCCFASTHGHMKYFPSSENFNVITSLSLALLKSSFDLAISEMESIMWWFFLPDPEIMFTFSPKNSSSDCKSVFRIKISFIKEHFLTGNERVKGTRVTAVLLWVSYCLLFCEISRSLLTNSASDCTSHSPSYWYQQCEDKKYKGNHMLERTEYFAIT